MKQPEPTPLRLPEQARQIAPDRASTAPYNFVPLPERVVAAVDSADDLPPLDTYATDRHTGWFDVTLTTRSPLYIRAGLERARFDAAAAGQEPTGDFKRLAKNAPEFFYQDQPAEPVIPGSSLRGMLRSLVEIVSYGKLERVTTRQLFYRSVDNSRLGEEYRRRMVGPVRGAPGENKVEAGFLHQVGSADEIRPARKLVIHYDDLAKLLGGRAEDRLFRNRLPNWDYQHRRIFVAVAADGRKAHSPSFQPKAGLLAGTLVITGPMILNNPKKTKKHEFVFLDPDPTIEPIEVPSAVIERFEDDDQITQHQEQAFPCQQPLGAQRRLPGGLDLRADPPGEPVFYLMEKDAQTGKDKLTFFGRAGMFRLPYLHSPGDLVPEELQDATIIDFADALFGYVKSIPGQHQARAGRVSVSDARLVPNQSDLWLQPEPLVPKILATPKPTAFQHYLVQPDPYKRALKHYDDRFPATTLRGHKLYWHQGERRAEDLAEGQAAPPGDTQHTQMAPLRAGVRFSFRVSFENLSDPELGALCWVLGLPGEENQDYCHTMGMGKPLGMGAVKLAATLQLTNRRGRYARLFAGTSWEEGLANDEEDLTKREILDRRVRPFCKAVLQKVAPNQSTVLLHQLDRIRALLALLAWPGRSPEEVRVPSPRDFSAERRVLPTPLEVAGNHSEQPPTRTGGLPTPTLPGGRPIPGGPPPPGPKAGRPESQPTVPSETTAPDPAPRRVSPLPTPPTPLLGGVRVGQKVKARILAIRPKSEQIHVRLETAGRETINIKATYFQLQRLMIDQLVDIQIQQVDPRSQKPTHARLVG
jgi:CRISPR-associated protein (TIGR03986 family)